VKDSPLVMCLSVLDDMKLSKVLYFLRELDDMKLYKIPSVVFYMGTQRMQRVAFL
jgi:hypothetical protein